MGKAEEKVARELRRSRRNAALIAAVAIAGTIAVAAIAPKLVGALANTRYARQLRYRERKRISALAASGYLAFEERDGKRYARLTKKGERFAALMHKGALAPKRPKRWDGKWRLLMFDVPERRRRVRSRIRDTLKTIGFARLQDSVWAYPYDCEDFVIVLKAELKIGKDVLYVIADHVENDRALRAHFALPQS